MRTDLARTTLKPVDEILQYQNASFLKRFAQEKGIDEFEAARHFIALKQFLIVSATEPGVKVPSHLIDEIWHAFLKHSQEYEQFCNQFLGRVIHHRPRTTTSKEYTDTRAMAKRLFGSLDKQLWALKGHASCGCGDYV